MIKEIRDHIEAAIKSCDSRYKRIDRPFFQDNELPDTKVEFSYYIGIGVKTDVINDDLGNVGDVAVSLKLFRQGKTKKIEAFDESYTHAIIIKDLVLDNSLLNNKQYIKGIRSSNVTPAEILDSQDIYSYETNFNFTISYGLGD